ncbi:MMPL family transporter [Streptomyces roseus]|uniref:MMPL family transporter n=1 Tax=Streptomyces roseus TaxID=66430 RepID=UPI003819E0A9
MAGAGRRRGFLHPPARQGDTLGSRCAVADRGRARSGVPAAQPRRRGRPVAPCRGLELPHGGRTDRGSPATGSPSGHRPSHRPGRHARAAEGRAPDGLHGRRNHRQPGGPAPAQADLDDAFATTDNTLRAITLAAVLSILPAVCRSILMPLLVIASALVPLTPMCAVLYASARPGWLPIDGQTKKPYRGGARRDGHRCPGKGRRPCGGPGHVGERGVVALGVDYSIFLFHRVRVEALQYSNSASPLGCSLRWRPPAASSAPPESPWPPPSPH